MTKAERPRRAVAAFVRVAPAAVTTLALAEASANPPPPKAFPDPPVEAPKVDEAPKLIRRYTGICYAFYPSGGILPLECPTELLREPAGEMLIKQPSGRCQFAPYQSGYPGRTGFIDTCPAVFDQVAKAGVIPESVKTMLAERKATQAVDPDPLPPPLPVRLDNQQSQEVGCSTGNRAGSALPAVAVALAVAARRRRRAK